MTKQTKLQSLRETATDIGIGFVINYMANLVILPAFGYPVNVSKSLGISMCFTVIAIVRKYTVRRYFNRKGI